MNWDAIGAIGEIVGAAAVVITILYLAGQTRQASRNYAAQAPQWISDGTRNWFSSMREDPEFTALFRLSIHHWDRLNGNEQTRVHAFYCEQIVHLDAMLEMSNQGVIDTARTAAWIDNSLGLLITPGGGRWWESARHLFSPGIREVLDGRLAHPETFPPPWTALPHFQLDEGEDRRPT